MKRVHYRFLPLLLTVLLLLSSTAGVASASQAVPKRQYHCYTCLGDSIAAGFGIKKNPDGTFAVPRWEFVPNTYPAEVRDDLGCENAHMLAFSGFRTIETLRLLDPDFEKTLSPKALRLSNYILQTMEITSEEFRKIRSEAADDIRKSDLISINLGNNDVLSSSDHRSAIWKEDHPKSLHCQIHDWADTLSQYGEAGEEMRQIVQNNQKIFELSAFRLVGFQDYMTYWDQLIETIRAMNPTATIVVVGMYNPVHNWTGADWNPVPIGRSADLTVDLVTLYTSRASKVRHEYTFVDVPDTDIKPIPPVKDKNFFYSFV